MSLDDGSSASGTEPAAGAAEVPAAVASLMARWQGVAGSERANYQLFLTELTAALDLPRPEPAARDDEQNAYCFERRVTFRHGDGSESHGFIDLYRRSAFVLEAKDVKAPEGRRYDDAMLRARAQAEAYARALPATEGRPPFLVVVDVGHSLELYSEFTRSGATYTPFPDPRTHRIALADLALSEVRERLRRVWLDPLALDPSRQAARVTREIAGRLAVLARTFEEAGHDPVLVAGFLTRCLFTLFAEDVGLLPAESFQHLLRDCRENPAQLVPLLGELWRAMDEGAFSAAIRADLLRFNGKLFKDHHVLRLDREQVDLLLEAARARWDQVEPAIFGTLLERALDPEERHALGAHYTPRAYVERLVLPTVVEPLREEWRTAQAAALTVMEEGKEKDAIAEIRRFQDRLCAVRVLDPACGSGNFLYVTLEHLKRLEGEVLNQLAAFGEKQATLEVEGLTVDPHQFLGIEVNPRAAAIAELVLWIGYLQWHFRTRGRVMPAQPVLRDFRNIENRDAVLAWDSVEWMTDEQGRPVTRWDGRTMKKHPVTGEDVPDESATAPVERFVNPRKAEWPEADFVVGNPPFIGSKLMRSALGDGYVDALQAAWPELPQATDFVMRWWHHAASLTRQGRLQRFGLITTNTLRQTYVRRAVEPHLVANPPLSLVFAVPDHPWVETRDGAAVRIAMTVGVAGRAPGRLVEVLREHSADAAPSDDLVAAIEERRGFINADLTVGADLTAAKVLLSNSDLCSVGMKTIGAAFQISGERAAELGLGVEPGLDSHIRPYLNGRDLAQESRGVYVIDFFGLEENEVRRRFPAAYQHLLLNAKPERDHNRNAVFRRLWWVIGHPRPQFRDATRGLSRYIATIETSKHRFFVFLAQEIVPDSTLVTLGSSDAAHLGILSSKVHVSWSLATGGRLGVGNDPRYNKTRCFETFPFPTPTDVQATRIRSLAEQLDAHRQRQQATHERLTLTGMYNVLERLRAGEPLDPVEREINEQGLVSVVKQLHDDLDLAVLDAYGWNDLLPVQQVVNGNTAPATTGHADRDAACRALDEALLDRLVALNAERAAEERRGLVRWLRPEFQNPEGRVAGTQKELAGAETGAVTTTPVERRPWPQDLSEQVRCVADLLASSPEPLTEPEIAARFKARGTWRPRLRNILDILESLGKVLREEGQFRAVA